MVAWYGVWQAAGSLNTEVKIIYTGELNTIKKMVKLKMPRCLYIFIIC